MPIPPRQNFRRALLATSLALGLAASPVHAADVTPADAEDVARQLHGWFAATLGPNVKLPPDLVRVSAEGTRYRVALPWPFPVLRMQDEAGAPTEALFSAVIHKLDGTSWAIDALRMPALIGLTPEAAASLAGPADAAPKAQPEKTPAEKTPSGNTPAAPRAELRIREYSGTGMLDTALNAESRIDTAMQGLSFEAASLGAPGNGSRMTIDRATNQVLLRPNAAGGTDIVQNATIEGYASTSHDGANGEVRVNARRVSLQGEIGALMLPQIGTLLRAMIQLGVDSATPAPVTASAPGTATEKPGAAPLQVVSPGVSPVPPPTVPQGAPGTDANRATLRAVFAALKSILAGMTVEETIEGLAIEAQGQRGSVERTVFALGGGAPNGKLRAHVELGMDGLAMPSLPPQFSELVPRAFAVRPTIGNIDVAALTAIAEAAAAPNADPGMLTAQLMGLLAQGGVDLGIERLTLEMGPARLAGKAAITVTGPMTAKGTAEITMTGFDALMDKAQKMPDATAAIPVFALLRGLARAEKEKLVWRIVLAEDMKVTVNGVDITKLAGGK